MAGPVSAISGPVPQPPPTSDLRGAAQQFEALLLRQMLASARTADFGGDDLLGKPDTTFTEMRDARFAELAAGSGTLGIAATIERQLGRMTARGGQ